MKTLQTLVLTVALVGCAWAQKTPEDCYKQFETLIKQAKNSSELYPVITEASRSAVEGKNLGSLKYVYASDTTYRFLRKKVSGKKAVLDYVGKFKNGMTDHHCMALVQENDGWKIDFTQYMSGDFDSACKAYLK